MQNLPGAADDIIGPVEQPLTDGNTSAIAGVFDDRSSSISPGSTTPWPTSTTTCRAPATSPSATCWPTATTTTSPA
ncbi:MAG: hypothetical protein U0168_10705 [Nannocystaceae bacterium]